MLKLWIKDKCTGMVREYGTNHHDSLIVDRYGRIKYYNLQNGGGTGFGAYSEYEFVPDPDDGALREIFNLDNTIDIGGYHTEKEYRKMFREKKKLDLKLCKMIHKGQCRRPCLGCKKRIITLD